MKDEQVFARQTRQEEQGKAFQSEETARAKAQRQETACLGVRGTLTILGVLLEWDQRLWLEREAEAGW